MRLLRHAGLCCLLLGSMWGLADVQAQVPDGLAHHAAVVVQYGPGQLSTRCVGFSEDSISGFEALNRAGYGVISAASGSMGALVCSIDGTGCDYPNESCTCRCEGAECVYWAYSHQLDGVWRYSPVGGSAYRVRDGAVEGWAWGGGSVATGSTPPLIDWSAVCGAMAAAPPTVPPSATAAPPTAAPPPSATTAPPPSATAAPPTAAPPASATAAPASATAAPASATAAPSAAPVALSPAVPTAPSPEAAPGTSAAVAAPTAQTSVIPGAGAAATSAPAAPALPGGARTPSAAPSAATSSWTYGLVLLVAALLVLGAVWRRRR